MSYFEIFSWFAAKWGEMSDESATRLLELGKKLQILSLSYMGGLTGVPWMSRLPSRAPELQLIRLRYCRVPLELAERAAKDRPGLVVAYREYGPGDGLIDRVFRAVKEGDDLMNYTFRPTILSRRKSSEDDVVDRTNQWAKD